jgi:hypothetical protein
MGARCLMPGLGPGQDHGLLAKQFVQRGQPVLKAAPLSRILRRRLLVLDYRAGRPLL